MTPELIERLKKLPPRKDEVWQGGPCRIPCWIRIPGTETRALLYSAHWATTRDHRGDELPPRARSEISAEGLFAGFVAFAESQKPRPGRPRKLQTSDAAFAEAARAALAEAGVEIECVERLVLVDPRLRDFAGRLGAPAGASLLAAKGMTPEIVRDFAEAAAAFRTGAPWRTLAFEDYVEIEPRPLPDVAGFCVYGWGGARAAIATYGSLDAFLTRLKVDPIKLRAAGSFFVHFGRPWEIEVQDFDLFQSEGLSFPDEDGYPRVDCATADGRDRRPSVRELTAVAALLRAVATVTESEAAAGAFVRTLPSRTGPVETRFTLPFATPDRTETPADADDHDRFLALYDDAMRTRGRSRRALLHEALAILPDDPNILVALSEEAATAEEALAFARRAVEAEERRIGPEAFIGADGLFADDRTHGPYLRALQATADCLVRNGRKADSVDVRRRLLDLDAADELEVRYDLARSLLELGRYDEVVALDRLFEDDGSSLLVYIAALAYFLKSGPSEEDDPLAVDTVEDAFHHNPFVADFLLDPTDGKALRDATPDEREDALSVVESLEEYWLDAPGALDWLEKRFDAWDAAAKAREGDGYDLVEDDEAGHEDEDDDADDDADAEDGAEDAHQPPTNRS